MKLTLKSRLIFWIWGFTALLFSVILYLNYSYNKNQDVEKLRENSVVSVAAFASVYQEVLSKVSAIPRMNAVVISSGLFKNQDEIREYLKSVVEKNPDIYGACLAFEPYRFNKDLKMFAPYYYRPDGTVRFKQLGDGSYSYMDKNWYKEPGEKRAPVWSEPYLDTDGGNALMATYSVPIYQNDEFIGVATVDLSLNRMTDSISNVKLSKTGYIFVVSKKGQFISYPDRDQIMKGNILDFNEELGKQMTDGRIGFMKTFDPLKQEKSWITYYPVKNADYSIAMVYPEKEVLENVFALQNVTLIFGSAGLIILLFILIFVSRSVTSPISDLVKDAQKVAHGDLDHPISVESRTIEVETLKDSLNSMITNLREYIDNLNLANAGKERLFVSSIKALANAIEARDAYTRGHSERVTKYSVKIAEKMGIEKDEIEKIRYAAVLHDIGKIKIREEILNKPGKLTDEEFDILKQHPTHGAKMLKPVEEFNDILPYLYHHHERYDGRGYPQGLSGSSIPLASRIMAVADTFDAMTSNRPYRKAMPVSKAIVELEKNAGTQFDPEIVKLFLDIIKNEKEWLFTVMEEEYSTMDLD